MDPVRKGGLHPLQNPDILEIIFKGSTLEEFKNYRLVCRAWTKESSRAMKKIAKVRIHGDKEDEDGRRGLSAFRAVVESELSTFAEDKTSPADTVLLSGIEEQDPKFWTVFGHRIKSLKMMTVDFKNVEEYRHAIFQSCPNLVEMAMVDSSVGGVRDGEPIEYIPPRFPENRNLKTLKLLGLRNRKLIITSSGIIRLPGRKEFGVTWMEILVQFPSLEELEVRCLRKTEDQHLLRSLEIVRQHENRHRNWKVIDLTIDFAPPAVTQPIENPQILSNANLPLMDLEIRATSEDKVAPRKTLELYAGSIKKLTLSPISEGPNETFFLETPRVPPPAIFPLSNHPTLLALQELDLSYGYFDSMAFLKYLPALKRLSMPTGMLRNTSNLEVHPIEGCVDLCLETCLETIDAEDVRKLGLWLPNIRNLKIDGLTSDSFAAVCKVWSNLESLDFDGSCVGNRGITGMSREDVERINREGSSGYWKPTMERKANITYLKNLRKLSIKPGFLLIPFNLGFCSAAYGIQCLPQLQQLKLCVDSDDGELWNLWKPILEQFPWKDD